MMSRNFRIYQGDEESDALWLELHKEGGRVGDYAKLFITNYVKDEETGEFGCLSFCKFDTLDSGAFKQRCVAVAVAVCLWLCTSCVG